MAGSAEERQYEVPVFADKGEIHGEAVCGGLTKEARVDSGGRRALAVEGGECVK